MNITKVCSKCGVEKSMGLFPRHRSMPNGIYSCCKLCKSDEAKKNRQKNGDVLRAGSRNWNVNNRDRLLAKAKEWRDSNAAKRKSAWERWYAENKDMVLARRRATLSPAKNAMYSSARRARVKSGTPAWANQFFIEEIFDLAQRRTKATGFRWVVDHVIPLKNKLVCGLHVEHNLQVVPEAFNAKKHNSWWPDMPSFESVVRQ